MSSQATENGIKDAIVNMASSFADRLYAMSEEEVRERWNFEWDEKRTVTQNIYEFHEMLRLHQSNCRRWEEKHNGSCCVVERVRDKYLMPRIKDFEADLKKHI